MAELDIFGYRHGSTLVHRMDVRCKLISLLLLTSAIVAAEAVMMGLLTPAAILLWVGLGLPLRVLSREMRVFGLFLLLVFVIRVLVTPGASLLEWGNVSISREGLQEGGFVVWRLMMILVLGLVFVTTTRPSDLKAAVQWLLRPIPFLPGRKAATMVGLIVRFMPVLHQQVRETRSAMTARGGIRKGFSIRRIRYLVLPTMRRVMLAADQLSLAMLARGYQEERTDPNLRATLPDGLALAAVGAVLVLALIV